MSTPAPTRTGDPASGAPPLVIVATTVTVLLWASAFVVIRDLGPQISPGALTLDRPARRRVGVLGCFVAAVAYAVAVVLQKPLLGHLSGLQVTWIACTIGAVVCLPFVPPRVCAPDRRAERPPPTRLGP